MEDWFANIPEAKINSDPQLLSLKASIEVNKGNLPQGLDLLNTVIRLQQHDNNSALYLAENLVRRSTTCACWVNIRILCRMPNKLSP